MTYTDYHAYTKDEAIQEGLTEAEATAFADRAVQALQDYDTSHARLQLKAATEDARHALRPHSLYFNGSRLVRKTWKRLATAYGVSAWGYEQVAAEDSQTVCARS